MGEMPFTLEVTTPGIDKPLVLPRHWKKNIGRLVKITPKQGEKYVARIKGFSDDQVTLELKNEILVLSLNDVAKAQIEVEFNRKEVK